MRLIGLPLILAVGLALAPLTAGVQPAAKIPKIGILHVATAAATQHFFVAFKQGMRERGYVEGQHVVFERRFGENRREGLLVVYAISGIGFGMRIALLAAIPADIFAGRHLGAILGAAHGGGGVGGFIVTSPPSQSGPFQRSQPDAICIKT